MAAAIALCQAGPKRWPTRRFGRRNTLPIDDLRPPSGWPRGWPTRKQGMRSGLGAAVVHVRLLLDQPRSQKLVDLPLQGGAAVVLVVDRAGQLDEARAEVGVAFVDA